MAFSVLFDPDLFLFAPDCGGFRSSVLQMIPMDHNYTMAFSVLFDSDLFLFAPDCGGLGGSVLWTIQLDMTHVHGTMFVRSGAPDGQSAGQIHSLTAFDSDLFLFTPDCGGFRSSVLQMIPTDHNCTCVVLIAESSGPEEIAVDICYPEWHFHCFLTPIHSTSPRTAADSAVRCSGPFRWT
ncbi:hypothetical protein R3P38DRAFT_3194836 [Favolaschia claudopus]|uniref:Aberrant panicle organization 1 protein n=1 Tax=Favolaschia claudopus TaxID=2862362 RepID=A0AAW0BDQ0_9AGAR